MAVVSTEYRLPGVYSRETTGQMVAATVGGNAVVALVGPALGYLEASQRSKLNGVLGVTLNNSGVIADSYVVSSRENGAVYALNKDYEAVQDASGTTQIKRKITQTALSATSVSNVSKVYAVAEPTFNVLNDAAIEASGFLIKGTVTVTGNKTHTEGTDYVVDYYNGTITGKSAGNFENGETLTISYKWTTAEPIELVGETSAALSHKYISKNGLGTVTANLVLYSAYSSSSDPTPGSYTEGVDYIVDYQTGRISRTAGSSIPTFSEASQNYMYISYGYSGIRSGDEVTIRYKYIDADYNNARYFSGYRDLAAYYGAGWDSEGNIVSPLTAAAYLATQNGLSGCWAVAVNGSIEQGGEPTYTLQDWTDAFEKLTVVDGIDIVVPLSGDSAVWSILQAHINLMKDNEDERVAIVGADGTQSVIEPTTLIGYAESFNSEDIWMVAPSTFRIRNIVTGIIEPIPAYYIAAGIAGLNSGLQQYVPLTQKTVSGLYSANEYNTKQVKKNESANGLMYVDEASIGMKILHGRTTCTDSIVKQESNIVLAKNYIIKTMRRQFENGYIGSIINDETLSAIRAAAYSVLCSLRDGGFMSAFNNLTVAVDLANRTQVNISFAYTPTYSLNYIEISFSIDANE